MDYYLVEIGVNRSKEHAQSETFEIPDNAQIVRVQGCYEEKVAGTDEKTGNLVYIITYAVPIT